MSVVVVSSGADVDTILVRRLIQEGDEVRVVVDEHGDVGDEARALGAHVATGPIVDADLIERAAQDARSVVVYEDARAREHRAVVEAVVEAARSLGETRVILWGKPSSETLAALPGSGVEHVVLETGARGRLLGWSLEPASVAEAIDAADDIRDVPQRVLDLRREESWRALGLAPR